MVRVASWAPRVNAPVGSGLVTVALFAVIVVVRPSAFCFDDFESQYLPAYTDVARALREGSFPLLSPYSWFGGALAGEYQYGVFSAFLLPLVALLGNLPLTPLTFAFVLAAVHLVVLATGCAVLVQSRGAPPWLAVLLGSAVSLSGFFFTWGVANWFPMATAFAWTPWVVWAFGRALEAPPSLARVAPAGALLYLLLTGGWPFTCVSVLVLTFFEAAIVCARKGSLRPLLPFAAAWVLGVLLASPALLMLIQHTLSSDRMHDVTPPGQWAVPPDAFLGLLIPGLPVQWLEFLSTVEQPAMDTFVGLAIPVLVVSAFARGRSAIARQALPEIALVLLMVALSMSAASGPFRWPFRWLPALSLALSLLTTRVVSLVPVAFPRPAALVIAGLALALVGFPLVVAVGAPDAAMHAAVALPAVLVLWGVALRLVGEGCQGALAVTASAASLVIVHITLPNPHEVPDWPQPTVSTAQRLLSEPRIYLGLHPRSALYGEEKNTTLFVRAGNRGMLEERRWVNGYSPLGPRGLRAWFDLAWSGFVEGGIHARLAPYMASGGLFDQVGISGLVVPRYLTGTGKWFVLPRALEERWQTVQRDGRFLLLERKVAAPVAHAVPRVRFVEDAARPGEYDLTGAELPVLVSSRLAGTNVPSDLQVVPVEVVEDSRLTVRVRMPAGRRGWSGVVFSRAYFDGYRASLDGRSLPVADAYGMAPFVFVPPGEATDLVLSYRPRAAGFGVAAAGAALLTLGILWLRGRARSHQAARPV